MLNCMYILDFWEKNEFSEVYINCDVSLVTWPLTLILPTYTKL